MHNNQFTKILSALLIVMLAVMALPVMPVHAVTFETTQSGNWTAGATWLGGVAPTLSTDSVTIKAGHKVTLTAATSITSITIENTAELDTANFALTLNGNFTNSGTFTAGSSNITIAGSAAQAIDGFTTTGTVFMTKTPSGVATLNGNVSGGALTISGIGGTLNLGSGTHAFSGAWTMTNGTLEGGSSTLNLNGNVSGTGGVFTAGTSTVVYGAAGNQTLGTSSRTYNNLTISGGGSAIKTQNQGTATVNGTLTIAADTTFSIGSSSAAAVITGASSTTTINGTILFPHASSSGTFGGNVTINNGGTFSITAAVTTMSFAKDVTINSGGAWSETAAALMSFAGNLQNDGTLTASTGIHTFTGATKTIGGTGAISIPKITMNGSYTNTGTLTVASDLLGSGSLAQGGTNPVLNIGDATFAATTLTLDADNVANTVNYNLAGAQTVKATGYHHLILSNSGAKTITGLASVLGDLSITGAASTTATTADLAIGGNLMIDSTATTPLTVGAFTFSVGGTTSVYDGALTFNNHTSQKTFTGAVLIEDQNSSTKQGSWSNLGAPVIFKAGLTNNKTDGTATFAAGTGMYTFNTADQAIGGTGAMSIPNVTITGFTLTNNGTLTITTSLAGNGTLTQAASSNLTLQMAGASLTLTNMNAAATDNTVTYNLAGDQTVHPATYFNLTLGGGVAPASSLKTTAGIIVNGLLSMEGNATVSAVPTTYGTGATIQYNLAASTTARTVGVEWPATFEGSGGVVIKGTRKIYLNENKIVTAGLTINDAGSFLYTGDASGVPPTYYDLTVGSLTNNGTLTTYDSTITVNNGDFINDKTVTTTAGSQILITAAGGDLTLDGGTFTAEGATISVAGDFAVNSGATFKAIGLASSLPSKISNITLKGNFTTGGTVSTVATFNLTLDGTGVDQQIAGFTTTGNVSVTKTAGTATFTGNVSAAALTLSGAGSTLKLDNGSALAHTFSGVWTMAANTTLNASASTLTLKGASTALISNVNIAPSATFTKGTSTVQYVSNATQNIAGLTYYNLSTGVVSGTASFAKTTIGDITISGNLSIGSYSNFTVGLYDIQVDGTTSIAAPNGVLTHTSALGANTNTYKGLVTIAVATSATNNGKWTNAGNADIKFQGGLTNNGTFTAGTGTYTFDTNPQTIAGTGALTITNVNAAGITLTNANTGGLTVSAAAPATATLSAANFINNGKFIAGATSVATISNDFTNGATAAYTATAGSTLNIAGNFDNGSGTFTTGTTGYAAINLGGNYTDSGTVTSARINLTLNGTGAQSIAAIDLNTGTLSMAKSSDTATLAGNVGSSTTVAGPLVINGSGGTLNLGTGTHYFSAWTMTAGNLNTGSSTMNVSGAATSEVSGWAFTAPAGTVSYIGNAAQNILGLTYYNLNAGVASGTAVIVKTTNGPVTVQNNLTVGPYATFTTGEQITVNGTTTIAANGKLTHGSALYTNIYTGMVTINGTWENAVSSNADVTFRGGLTNNGTLNAGATANYKFDTNDQTISGTKATSIPKLEVVSIILTNKNLVGLTIGTRLYGTGTFVQAANAILNIGGLSDITGMIANAGGNTVNYTFSGAQTVHPLSNLTGTLAVTDGSTGIKGTGTLFQTQAAGGNLLINNTLYAVSGFSLTGTADATNNSKIVRGTGSAFTTELQTGDKIYIDVATTPYTVSSFNLTGTLGATNGSTGVKGTGTAFKTETMAGDNLYINGDRHTIANFELTGTLNFTALSPNVKGSTTTKFTTETAAGDKLYIGATQYTVGATASNLTGTATVKAASPKVIGTTTTKYTTEVAAGDTLYIGGNPYTVAPTASTLSGNVTATAGSTKVIGASTEFTTEMIAGHKIYIAGAPYTTAATPNTLAGTVSVKIGSPKVIGTTATLFATEAAAGHKIYIGGVGYTVAPTANALTGTVTTISGSTKVHGTGTEFTTEMIAAHKLYINGAAYTTAATPNTLTGNVKTTNGSIKVIGIATAFTTEVFAGDNISINGLQYVVAAANPTTLTGTVSVTNGSTSVIGIGTDFAAAGGEVLATHKIYINGVQYTVATVTNDTALVLSTPYAGATDNSGSLTVTSDNFLKLAANASTTLATAKAVISENFLKLTTPAATNFTGPATSEGFLKLNENAAATLATQAVTSDNFLKLSANYTGTTGSGKTVTSDSFLKLNENAAAPLAGQIVTSDNFLKLSANSAVTLAGQTATSNNFLKVTAPYAGITASGLTVRSDNFMQLTAVYTGATATAVTIKNEDPNLTGTIAVANGSPNVTGTGTLFLTQAAPDDVIYIDGNPYEVASVTNDTALVLTANYAGATASGLSIQSDGYLTLTTPYAGNPGTESVTVKSGYYNLNLSGSGAKTMANISSVNGNLTLATATATTTGTGVLKVDGNLVVTSGTLNIGSGITVNGATTISGILNHELTSTTNIYEGMVTLSGTGKWTSSADVRFHGGLTNNSTTIPPFTSGVNNNYFETNSQEIGGTKAISIDNLNIASGITLANNNTGGLTLTAGGTTSGGGTLTQGAGGVLNIQQTDIAVTLDAQALNNTVNYTFAGAQTVRYGTYYNLTLGGSGTKTLGGAATLKGNLTINSPVTFALDSQTMNIKGNWLQKTGSATTATGSTVIFDGTAAQTIGGAGTIGTTFENLTIDNALGVILSSVTNNDTTVNGVLTLTNGIVTTTKATTASRVVVAGTGSIVCATDCMTSHIKGDGGLRKFFTTGTGQDFTFPLGDVNGYRPLSLISIDIDIAGYVNASVPAALEHPQVATSGINALQDTIRYWSLVPGGGIVSSGSYDMLLEFETDQLDSGVVPTAGFFVAKKYQSTWSSPTVLIGDKLLNSTKLTGLTGLAAASDYVLGELPSSTMSAVSAVNTAYGNTVTLSAKLMFTTTPIVGKTVTFKFNGVDVTPIATATTGADGVATLSNVLVDADFGTYATGVSATFAGDDNYGDSTATASLNVTKRPITVTAVTSTKEFDALNTSIGIPTITTGSLVAGDGITWSQTFNDETIATGKTLTPAGTADIGTSPANYNITYVTATGTITKKALTVSGVGISAPAYKTYDGTTDAVHDDDTSLIDNATPVLTGKVDGYLDVDITVTGGVFPTKDAGTHNIAITGDLTGTGSGTLGDDANNYYTLTPIGSLSATINKAPIASLTVDSDPADIEKTYDGTTASSGTPTYSGTLYDGDYVIQTYALKDAGSRLVTSYIYDRVTKAKSTNYDVASTNDAVGTTAAGTINKVDITYTADNKFAYVGSSEPEYTYTLGGSGFVGTDNFTTGNKPTCTVAGPVNLTTISLIPYVITCSGGAVDTINYNLITASDTAELLVVQPLSATYASVGAYDGSILSADKTNLVGGNFNNSNYTFNLGDNAVNKQFRGILHFNTDKLGAPADPAKVVVVSAKIKIKKAGFSGRDPFTTHGMLYANMSQPSFGSPDLASDDFATTIGIFPTVAGAFGRTPVSSWYTVDLTNSAKAAIDASKNLQFRLRFTKPTDGDSISDYVLFYSGNALKPADRPQLFIEYYVKP